MQDTARAQFEHKKSARRNVYAQAAARGNEWGAAYNGSIQHATPRLSNASAPRTVNSSMRMRSGSGTSRTTTTSDSGDWNENYTSTSQSQSQTQSRHNTLGGASAASSLSPPRNGVPLPTGTPIPSTQSGNLSVAQSAMGANGLSPIASRMRAVDAEAMEKYKLRQRSGSAATASTDAPSQNESAISSHGPSEEEMTSLQSLVTVGSVAPRRRLRPSASAAQLRSPPSQPSNASSPAPVGIHHEITRARNGSSPGVLKRHPSLSSATSLSTSKESTPTTPTQSIPRAATSSRPSLSKETRDKEFMGPSAEYARFPPPPAEPPHPVEKDRSEGKSTTPTSMYTRRIPFFSSHKHSADREKEKEKEHHGFGHKRNTSAQSLTPRVV